MQPQYTTSFVKNTGNKLFYKIIGLLFICIFSVPLIAQLIGFAPENTLNENRAKVPMPTFNIRTYVEGGYAKQFSMFYNDNYGMREQFISLNGEIWDFLGVNTNLKVVMGKENWLYYIDEVKDYRKIATLSDEQVSQIIEKLANYQKALRRSGKEFVFVIAPNKSSIYPEYMPDEITVTRGESNYEKLVRAMESNGKINYILLKDSLIKAKIPDKPLYFLTDTHWNTYGAYHGARPLLANLASKYNKSIELPRITAYESSLHLGDLDNMRGITTPAPSLQVQIEPRITNSKITDNVFWYRDSFGESLIPMCAPYFRVSKDWAVNRDGIKPIPKEYYQGTDLVVLEIVERSIPNLLSYDFNFNN